MPNGKRIVLLCWGFMPAVMIISQMEEKAVYVTCICMLKRLDPTMGPSVSPGTAFCTRVREFYGANVHYF